MSLSTTNLSNITSSAWTQPPSTPSNQCWSSIAMSSSGQYQSACIDLVSGTGGIYISTNYGNTWSLSSAPSFSIRWITLAMSGTGQYQNAILFFGNFYIYNSTDYGKTWISKGQVNCSQPQMAFSFSGSSFLGKLKSERVITVSSFSKDSTEGFSPKEESNNQKPINEKMNTLPTKNANNDVLGFSWRN
jgi:hypothetical protein